LACHPDCTPFDNLTVVDINRLIVSCLWQH
jgi:hypothetical protein